MDNPVHAMKFPCFSIPSFIPFKKMITKRETSATNDISLELTYESRQESKCKPQASRVSLHLKEER
jgi:hypothetical protein